MKTLLLATCAAIALTATAQAQAPCSQAPSIRSTVIPTYTPIASDNCNSVQFDTNGAPVVVTLPNPIQGLPANFSEKFWPVNGASITLTNGFPGYSINGLQTMSFAPNQVVSLFVMGADKGAPNWYTDTSPSTTVLASSSVPVSTSSFTLPLLTGFASFLLTLDGLQGDGEGSPVISFSTDGGVTWINDATHLDSYQTVELGLATDLAASNTAVAAGYIDSVIDNSATFSPAASRVYSASITIYPGSATTAASIVATASGYDAGSTAAQPYQSYSFSSWLNPSATNPPTLKRITNIRIDASYGTGAVGSGTVHFTGGRYTMSGFP